MNGNVMPLAGIRCKFTAMLIADCVAKRMVRPAAANRVNGSSFRMARSSMRMTMKANSATITRQSAMPNSSAAHKAFGCDVDVEGVARRGIEKTLNAARDVRHCVVGAEQADAGQAGNAE